MNRKANRCAHASPPDHFTKGAVFRHKPSGVINEERNSFVFERFDDPFAGERVHTEWFLDEYATRIEFGYFV